MDNSIRDRRRYVAADTWRDPAVIRVFSKVISTREPKRAVVYLRSSILTHFSAIPSMEVAMREGGSPSQKRPNLKGEAVGPRSQRAEFLSVSSLLLAARIQTHLSWSSPSMCRKAGPKNIVCSTLLSNACSVSHWTRPNTSLHGCPGKVFSGMFLGRDDPSLVGEPPGFYTRRLPHLGA